MRPPRKAQTLLPTPRRSRQNGPGVRLTLQGGGGLRFNLQLQCLDFSLLVDNLLLKGRGHGGLPFLPLKLFCTLVILLYHDVAGITRVPDQTIWPRR